MTDRGITSTITVTRMGRFHVAWEARGVLTEPIDFGSTVVMPGGGATLVGQGVAWSQRGAVKLGRKALRSARVAGWTYELIERSVADIASVRVDPDADSRSVAERPSPEVG
jgi:hypothetical protein